MDYHAVLAGVLGGPEESSTLSWVNALYQPLSTTGRRENGAKSKREADWRGFPRDAHAVSGEL